MKNINYTKTITTSPYEELSSYSTSSYITLEDLKNRKSKISGKFEITSKSNDLIARYTTYIKEVIYNDPATIVMWSDNTKTISKCAEGDIYSAEIGLVICILKKIIGATNLHNVLDDWLPTSGNRVSLKNVRTKHKK